MSSLVEKGQRFHLVVLLLILLQLPGKSSMSTNNQLYDYSYQLVEIWTLPCVNAMPWSTFGERNAEFG